MMETNDPLSSELVAASDGNRILAYIIDMLIVVGVSFIPRIGWMLALAYVATRDALPFLEGQSIGKKAMKLRAVTMEGAPLTNNWNAGLVRNIVLLIPFFPLVELIVFFTNPDRLRLGDQWAKTRVISVA
ncbi:MAG: RDD family protein [Saprospiraceae bacterium]|jgi:uncharacterized RDD family membrane protein YckC|nr:RDD family protein [Saprospiraceae bacterium]